MPPSPSPSSLFSSSSFPISRRYFSLQYFYLLTEQGYLYHLYDPTPFIKENKVPCGPAYLRNDKFLDFFFKNLHRTPPELPHSKLFPFVSRCGKEGNFLAVPGVFAPIVFSDASGGEEKETSANTANANDDNKTALHQTQSRTLKFGGSLTQELDPSLLREYQGRLYHPVGDQIKGLSSKAEPIKPKKSWRDRLDKMKNGNAKEKDDEAHDDFIKIFKEQSQKASSECVDPLQVEEMLNDFNEGKFKETNSFYDEMVNSKITVDLGLVSSPVAFDIGFNFITDDSTTTDEADNTRNQDEDKPPEYVISLDGGKTEIPVKSLW